MHSLLYIEEIEHSQTMNEMLPDLQSINEKSPKRKKEEETYNVVEDKVGIVAALLLHIVKKECQVPVVRKFQHSVISWRKGWRTMQTLLDLPKDHNCMNHPFVINICHPKKEAKNNEDIPEP